MSDANGDGHAPDVAGFEVGWRCFHVPENSRKEPRLYSLGQNHRTLWRPGEAMVAKCDSGCQDVPGDTHSCGFYAARTLAHLLTMNYRLQDVDGWFIVLGEVTLWGKTVPGTQGWRARNCYPQRLLVPHVRWRVAPELAQAYGVPVVLTNFRADRLSYKKGASSEHR